MMPLRGYLLCCLPRTGSKLFVEALSGTGVAGRPLEYFNPFEQEKAWMREILGDSSMVNGLSKILAAGATPNGVFGAKLHWLAFRHLGMRANGTWTESERDAPREVLRAQLPTLLPPATAKVLLRARFSDLSWQEPACALLLSHLRELHFIWLRRQNMVARAVSQFRAWQTGVWFQRSKLSEGGRDAGKSVPNFDLAGIHKVYCLGDFEEESWGRFFQEHRISPHCVSYEELVADYETVVRRALRFLGIEVELPAIPPPRAQKQSDGLSEEWERRYREFMKQHADTGQAQP